MTAYSVATNVTSDLGTPAASTTQTFTYTPVKVGNLIFMAVGWLASGTTLNSISSSNATWSTIQAKTTGAVGSNTWAFQFFIGIASSTAAQTVSVVFSAQPTAIQIDSMEFTANWLGLNPANWLFKVLAPIYHATSTSITWGSLTGFSFDDFFIGYGFMGGGAFTGTNGTPAGFIYNSGAANANPFCWHLTYGVGPSTPVGTQAASGTYLTFQAVFALYPSLVPATIDAGST